MEKVLPLGSVVYLKNSKEKVMIVSRGAIFGDENNEEYFDYLGCHYPNGIDREKSIFFNETDIDEVIFEGYQDESEKRISRLFLEWRKTTDITKGTL